MCVCVCFQCFFFFYISQHIHTFFYYYINTATLWHLLFEDKNKIQLQRQSRRNVLATKMDVNEPIWPCLACQMSRPLIHRFKLQHTCCSSSHSNNNECDMPPWPPPVPPEHVLRTLGHPSSSQPITRTKQQCHQRTDQSPKWLGIHTDIC